MKKHLFLYLLSLLSISLFAQNSQTDCKVLLESISEIYKGECKKGLAHGSGYAEGIDKYEGNFKKGLPDGKGTYTWESGDVYEGSWKKGMMDGKGTMSVKIGESDSLVEGYWDDNKYIGKTAKPVMYKVLERQGMERYNIYRVDDQGGTIEVFFTMLGNIMNPSNLYIYSTTGNESATFTGYDNVEYPVKTQITYQRSNQLGEGTIECRFTVEFFEPGRWEIHLAH